MNNLTTYLLSAALVLTAGIVQILEPQTILTGILAFGWLGAPDLVMLGVLTLCRHRIKRAPPSVNRLVSGGSATIAIAGVAMLIYIIIIVHDAQGSIAVAMVPVYEWICVIVWSVIMIALFRKQESKGAE